METAANIRVITAIKFNDLLLPMEAKAIANNLRTAFAEKPLNSFTADIASAEIDGLGEVENYSFLIVRRFEVNGVLHVGGYNGEILNTKDYLTSIYRATQG